MTGTLSILGLWMYDNTLFDNMQLPDGVDAGLVRDTILTDFSDLEVLYPSAPFMKQMIELWSRRELPTWKRVFNAMQLEYNPIENYDRIEDWTDSRNNSAKTTETASGSSLDNTSTIRNGTAEHKVAGYNDSGLVRQAEDDTSEVGSDRAERNINNSTVTAGEGLEHGTRKGRIHGNIGVTTSQQMLQAELNIAPELNIVQYIAKSFKMRFCVLVY